MIWLAAAVLVWLVALVLLLSLCKIAARADERIERMHWRDGR